MARAPLIDLLRMLVRRSMLQQLDNATGVAENAVCRIKEGLECALGQSGSSAD